MTDTSTKNAFDSTSVILSALAISAVGALFYNVLPLYLGTAQDFRELGNREIGFISSAFFLGYNAVTIWAFFWIRRWSWRIVTWVALPVALLGLLAGAWAQSYLLLLLTTVVAGGGFAAIYGIGTTILADTSNPAHWYVQEEFADIDRRPIWTTLFATFVFFSVGPGVAGALADSGSFAPVLVVAGTAIVLSMVQMRYSDRFRQL